MLRYIAMCNKLFYVNVFHHRLALLMNLASYMLATYLAVSMSLRCQSTFRSLAKLLGSNCQEASG